ncbi:mCG128129, partial [Mus musculus]
GLSAAGPLGRWAAGPLGRWAAGPLGRWAAGPGPPRVGAAHVEWRPRRGRVQLGCGRPSPTSWRCPGWE